MAKSTTKSKEKIDPSSFFVSKKAGVTGKMAKQKTIEDPVLYLDPDPDVWLLLSEPVLQAQLYPFVTAIKKHFKIKVGVLCTLPFVLGDKPGNLEPIFRDHTIDLRSYIKASSRVVTLGRGLYSALLTTDLQVEAFYDSVWNKTWAYAPSIASAVYPANAFDQIWNVSTAQPFANFEWRFFLGQMQDCLAAPKLSTRVSDLKRVLVEDPNAFLEERMGPMAVAWDTETRGMNYMLPDPPTGPPRVICLTLSFDGMTGYYLRWKDIDPEVLDRFFVGKYCIAANGKYDMRFLRHRGVKHAHVDFDTRNGGHVLNQMRSNGLKAHAYWWTRFGGYEIELDRYKDRYPSCKDDYGLIPESMILPYACDDASVAFLVYLSEKEELSRDPLLATYFYDHVMPAIEAYTRIELRGICVNWERAREVKKILDDDLKVIEGKIYLLFPLGKDGNPIPLGSPSKLGAYLEETMKWPALERSKSSAYKTGKKLMEEYSKLGYKGSDLLAEHAELKSIANSFIGEECYSGSSDEEELRGIFGHDVPKKGQPTGLWKYRYPDGKIHGTFEAMLAKSDRNRSRDPNLQNGPKRGKYAKLVRSVFTVPDSSYLLIETDGKGIQLRCGASQSQDEELLRTFAKGEDGDMHSKTAWSLFSRSYKRCRTFVTFDDGLEVSYDSVSPIAIIRNEVETTSIGWNLLEGDIVGENKKKIRTVRQDLNVSEDFTLEDFKSHKNEPVFKTQRASGKIVNLATEFGQSPIAFGRGELKRNWSHKQCVDYLHDHGAENRAHDILQSMSGGSFNIDLDDARYIACAEIIIEQFFALYPGLKAWQEQNIETAHLNGYIRSPFGHRRLLPYLTYTTGADVNRRKIKNLMNITANDPVQNHEVCLVNGALVLVEDYIEEHHLESGCVGNIHDSILAYGKRDETAELVTEIHRCFSIDYPENAGVPFGAETDIADIHKGDVWGWGSTSLDSKDEIDANSEDAFGYDEDVEEEEE